MSSEQNWKELSCAQAERWVRGMGDTTPGLSPGSPLAGSGTSQQTHLPGGTPNSSLAPFAATWSSLFL